MVVDPPENTLVDLGALDLYLVILLLLRVRIEVRHQLARPIAIIAAEALARIVEPSVLVAFRNGVLEGVRIGPHQVAVGRQVGIVGLELEPAALRLGDHPDERDVGQRSSG